MTSPFLDAIFFPVHRLCFKFALFYLCREIHDSFMYDFSISALLLLLLSSFQCFFYLTWSILAGAYFDELLYITYACAIPILQLTMPGENRARLIKLVSI